MFASALVLDQPSAVAAMPPADDLSWPLLGPSAAMSKLWAQVRRVAPHFRTALLTGELGCAQEAVVRLLHDLSPASGRQFLVLDADQAELVFAHHNGTADLPAEVLVYLPELEKLSAQGQAGLSRLLRQRRPRALAVIGSARTDLRAQVSAGTFRADLAGTLGALRITMPALRERVEDLPMLLHTLLNRRATRLKLPVPLLSEEFLREAMAFAWPGNLSQAAAALDWLLKHIEHTHWSGADLCEALAQSKRQAPPPPAPIRMVTLDQVMNEHIHAVLMGCKGNKLRAAEVLGISRSTLYRMLETSQIAS